MTFEDELRSDLGDIRVPEALAPRADLADTVLTGMRRQTRRRMSVVAGSLAVALAVAGATAPVWLSRRPSSGPAAPTVTAPTGQVCVGGVLPTRPPSPTREYFDPLASEINASGVTGYRLTASGTATHFQVVDMVNQAGDRAVGMVLYSAGGQPHYLDDNDVPVPFDPGAGEPAGSVGGAPAYWLPEKRYNLFNTRPQGIAWQWAPDAWAVVLAEQVIPGRDPSHTPDPATVDRAELRTIAAQVAPQFKLGVATPVTSPFSVRQPDCTRIVLTVRSYSTPDHGEPVHGVPGRIRHRRPSRTHLSAPGGGVATVPPRGGGHGGRRRLAGQRRRTDGVPRGSRPSRVLRRSRGTSPPRVRGLRFRGQRLPLRYAEHRHRGREGEPGRRHLPEYHHLSRRRR